MIVSNTTPLSNVLQLGLLEVLRQIFGNIVIPEAVARELDEGHDFIGEWRQQSKHFIQVISLERNPLTQQLLMSLHRGEAEAISLAVRENARLLLCDDLDARRLALYHGLKVTGTLGILLKAKQSGLLPAITPYLDKLRREARFWFTDDLYAQLQSVAGESE